jgi:hypothetical protein
MPAPIHASMFPQAENARLIAAGLLCALLLAGCAGLRNRPAPTLEQVVTMSREGKPADEIIRELQDTRAVYPLTASQILALHEQGLPESVLDYLQNAYVEGIRLDERMRLQGTIWWYDCFYCYHGPVIVVPY